MGSVGVSTGLIGEEKRRVEFVVKEEELWGKEQSCLMEI